MESSTHTCCSVKRKTKNNPKTNKWESLRRTNAINGNDEPNQTRQTGGEWNLSCYLLLYLYFTIFQSRADACWACLITWSSCSDEHPCSDGGTLNVCTSAACWSACSCDTEGHKAQQRQSGSIYSIWVIIFARVYWHRTFATCSFWVIFPSLFVWII